MCIGTAWIFFGLGIALAPPPLLTATPPSGASAGPPVPLMYLFELIPTPIRLVLWCGTGLLACAAAFFRGPGRDGFGFIALSIMPTTRVIGYLWSYATYLAGLEGGNARGWVSACVWAVVLVLILIISGWAEVPRGSSPPKSRKELLTDKNKEIAS